MTERALRRETLAGCVNTPFLKLVALAAMIVDHIGMVIFPGVQIYRVIGRIAFPLYAWCLVVGAAYTRNIWKYALRVLITGLIAQPIYHTGTFLYLMSLVAPGLLRGRAAAFSLAAMFANLSIFGTLLLALLAIAAVRQKAWLSHVWGPALCMIASLYVNVSYGWRGVLFILSLYMARGSRPALAAVMIAFSLLWASGSASLTALRDHTGGDALLVFLSTNVLKLQSMAILALPFILIPVRARVPYPKWLAYAAYPAHLFVIKLIALMLGRL